MPTWLQPFFTSPILDIELRLLGLLILFLIVRAVLALISDHIFRRLDTVVIDLERRERLQTLLRAGRNLAVGIILIAVLADALRAIGLDMGVFLASVGVIGLVVSVSVQNFIRDYVGGILIVAEDQFRLGEVIESSGKKGKVERITLRATHLRDENGILHVISNGELRIVSNFSRKLR